MMDRLRTVIVDDEIHCLETLEWQLKKYCPSVDVILSSKSPKECVDFLLSNEIDLLFLDIEMPVLNGFDLLKQIPQRRFNIIFTTAYDEFEMEALKMHAVDYLLKPIDHNELIDAVTRSADSLADLDKRLNKVFELIDKSQSQRIVLTVDGEEMNLLWSEIVYVSKGELNPAVKLKSGRTLPVQQRWEELLQTLSPYDFQKINDRQVLNLLFAKRLKRLFFPQVELHDGRTLSVDRGYIKALRSFFSKA